jgi:hypothetical protein
VLSVHCTLCDPCPHPASHGARVQVEGELRAALALHRKWTSPLSGPRKLCCCGRPSAGHLNKDPLPGAQGAGGIDGQGPGIVELGAVQRGSEGASCPREAEVHWGEAQQTPVQGQGSGTVQAGQGPTHGDSGSAPTEELGLPAGSSQGQAEEGRGRGCANGCAPQEGQVEAQQGLLEGGKAPGGPLGWAAEQRPFRVTCHRVCVAQGKHGFTSPEAAGGLKLRLFCQFFFFGSALPGCSRFLVAEKAKLAGRTEGDLVESLHLSRCFLGSGAFRHCKTVLQCVSDTSVANTCVGYSGFLNMACMQFGILTWFIGGCSSVQVPWGRGCSSCGAGL